MHWYDKDGNPKHHEGKDGKPTTLREARKLKLYPSVTTIGNIMHKEGLVRWLQQEAAMMAADVAHRETDGEEVTTGEHTSYNRAWATEVIGIAREKTIEKADIGTEIHDTLEKFHEDPFGVTGDDQKMCVAIARCIQANTGLSLYSDFIPEARFCDVDRGYAGMCDLHTPAADLMTDVWVLDYKTKDGVDEKTRGYPEQAEQLIAYANGLKIAYARIANIFISRTPPEKDEPWAVKFFEHKDPMAWERFKHTLQLWQVIKKYGPYYEALIKQEK